MTITVKRRDITLVEQVEHGISLIDTKTDIHRWWDASFDGPLSTGEDVSLSRTGDTSTEALANLEAAIAEQGWEIR
ncbi:hypothetical protein [Streptomyces sp. AC495_CC817]|uniref:hypothetical protein n=1 Tax=Streptomyces sp. AC495_CC817 TaxID=2823900 RepID=UPI001C25B27A|nr:hypothetical protein [Streptomyces sp. AC495_CC817]